MNSYGARVGGIVGVIGGRKRPRLSADSTAIANCVPSLVQQGSPCQEKRRATSLSGTVAACARLTDEHSVRP